jgi:hypothetical protein
MVAGMRGIWPAMLTSLTPEEEEVSETLDPPRLDTGTEMAWL